jgi:epoxide hydrolase-like predicted phosphatase
LHGWEKRAGMTRRELFRLIDKADLNRMAILGQISPDEVWRRVAVQTGLSEELLHELKEQFFAAKELNRPLLNFLQSLRPHYKLAMLCNAWSNAREALERKFKLSQYFDLQVFSSEVGLAKPDARIYQLILYRLNLYPEQALFLDDKFANVDAARLVGMQGIHHQDNNQTIAAIKKALGQS